MGQDIAARCFTAEDFSRFAGRLAAETGLLGRQLREGGFTRSAYTAGFELEAWLLDRNYFPSPTNEAYLARLSSPLVVPELSRFNVELNGTPQPLRGEVLSALERELTATWKHCLQVAHEQESTLVLIGILPTVREQDLSLANISPLNRYFALNEQILRLRGGRPIQLDIRGREHLSLTHVDVMLEAATTSFQLHLQVAPEEAARFYNASLILSAPLVAVAANSPYLFATDLWDETRVPLFEQAVDTGDEAHPQLRRVTFGSGYLSDSALEVFEENLSNYPVLLPILFAAAEEEFAHLRLHNGTIWRWNRLLIGLGNDGRPHLRIEHRVMPAGPTIVDMIANAALYYGAVRMLACGRSAPERDLPFELARRNFYRAARDGLNARLTWLDGQEIEARRLLRDELLPMAQEGLARLEVNDADSERCLDLLAARVRLGQNGSAWQRAHMARHGRDLCRLTADYLEHQRSGMPVHEWNV
jgi:hypothetical protein